MGTELTFDEACDLAVTLNASNDDEWSYAVEWAPTPDKWYVRVYDENRMLLGTL